MNKQHQTSKRKRDKPSHRTNVFAEKARRLKEVGAPSVRLLTKAEVMAVANASFPSIWQWMRDGKFPRSRIVNGRSMWLSTEIEQWLAGLPLRPLKGDAPSNEAAA